MGLSENKAWTRIWLIVSCALFALITYINITKIEAYMNSDTAAEMYEYVKAVYRSHSFIPSNWINSNELLLRRNIFIAYPIFLLVKDYYLTYCISNILTSALVIFSFNFFLKKSGLRFQSRLVGIACLLGMYSFNLYQDSLVFFIIQAYAMYVIGVCLTLAFFADLIRRAKVNFLLLGITVLYALYMGIVGPKMTLLFYFPLVLAGCGYYILYRQKTSDLMTNGCSTKKEYVFSIVKDAKVVSYSLLILCVHLVGLVIFLKFFKQYTAEYYYDYSIKAIADILFNCYKQFAAFLESIDIRGRFAIASVNTLNFLAKIALLVWLVSMVVSIFRHTEHNIYKYICIVFLMAIVVSMGFMAGAVFENDVRFYFLCPTFSCIVFAMNNEILSKNKKRAKLKQLTGIAVLTCIVLNSVTYYIPMLKYESEDNADRKKIAEYALNELHCNAVFGEYWNSSLLSGLTNGRLDVSKILVYDFLPYKWLNNLDTYHTMHNIGICLTDDEENAIINNSYPSLKHLKKGKKVLEAGKYNLYFYKNHPLYDEYKLDLSALTYKDNSDVKYYLDTVNWDNYFHCAGWLFIDNNKYKYKLYEKINGKYYLCDRIDGPDVIDVFDLPGSSKVRFSAYYPDEVDDDVELIAVAGKTYRRITIKYGYNPKEKEES